MRQAVNTTPRYLHSMTTGKREPAKVTPHEGTLERGPKIMTADLVGEMPKLKRNLRHHSDTASRAACKFNTESAGSTTTSAWS